MNTDVSRLPVRMMRLPLRLRLAHLRALIRREPASSRRRHALVALLRDQSAVMPANENRSL
ncbi:MAG TPA: hypothetical protein VE111_11815 [Bradyrhizobium sp.]|nr:hypothetical protein [Bradyrhizobium sp.]